MILHSPIQVLTAPLVRELVDAKLIEMGLEAARRMHTRLGMPLYDVEQLLMHPNKENANVPHGPEATNLTLAENIKKEYALLAVFSQDVADAHMRGDLHLHDLGFIDRPYCSGQSLEYIKKFGLNLPNSLAMAKPAKHPEVLLAHMVKFAAALQCNFAGAIGWDAVNLFFAPYLVGMSDREVKQLAQMLIFEFSQQAVARGGQAIFTDLNLYWEVPKHFEDVPAIGPGGEFTGKTYGDTRRRRSGSSRPSSRSTAKATPRGRPFFFPKPLVHITEKFFQTEGHEEFLDHICDVAAEKGNTYFVFDRGETAKISECCRLSFKLEKQDLEDAKQPWKMRYSALQNVTLNLPRIAYKSGGDDQKLFGELTRMMELACAGPSGEAGLHREAPEPGRARPAGAPHHEPGRPVLPAHAPRELPDGHGGPERDGEGPHGAGAARIRRGLQVRPKVIAHMKLMTDQLSSHHDMHFVLEQTPAESTAYRFAKLDLKLHSPQAGHVVRGDISRGEVYYTNSTQLHVGCDVNPIERVKREGLFHPLIEAGAITHVWLGEQRPSSASLANFVKKVFRHSMNDQIAFSPEFTTCIDCGRTSRGLADVCPLCGSDEVEGITRITGYFTKINSWNKGKLGELAERMRNRGFFDAGSPAPAAGEGGGV